MCLSWWAHDLTHTHTHTHSHTHTIITYTPYICIKWESINHLCCLFCLTPILGWPNCRWDKMSSFKIILVNKWKKMTELKYCYLQAPSELKDLGTEYQRVPFLLQKRITDINYHRNFAKAWLSLIKTLDPAAILQDV
jgi:hypothetical protein